MHKCLDMALPIMELFVLIFISVSEGKNCNGTDVLNMQFMLDVAYNDQITLLAIVEEEVVIPVEDAMVNEDHVIEGKNSLLDVR